MATQRVTDLAVDIAGEGPPLLMVHGLSGTPNTFSPQVPRLATRDRVIRPDLPGATRGWSARHSPACGHWASVETVGATNRHLDQHFR